jgi:hypothetical protein
VRTFLALGITLLIFIGCDRQDDILPVSEISDNLKISENVGIRLETPFVVDNVEVNVKIQNPGVYTIRIFDISNRVISKEDTFLKQGDNIINVNTSVIPKSAYRISLSTNTGQVLGITDFNKL